jgi:hypothetical protein
MKVGDLVQVLPALMGFYIVIEKHDVPGVGGEQRWILEPMGGGYGGLMCEEFIVLISEVP